MITKDDKECGSMELSEFSSDEGVSYKVYRSGVSKELVPWIEQCFKEVHPDQAVTFDFDYLGNLYRQRLQPAPEETKSYTIDEMPEALDFNHLFSKLLNRK